MRVVSEPASGSVTPKDCRRSSPEAILGRNRCFCSSEPWRRSAPIVYMPARAAPAWQPLRSICSSTTAASRMSAPPPPNSSGMSMLIQPAS